jgi:hypothetical protein
MGVASCAVVESALPEIFGIDAIVHIVGQVAAILRGAAAIPVADADPQQSALRKGRLAGDDVDHAIDRIRSPEGAAGEAKRCLIRLPSSMT